MRERRIHRHLDGDLDAAALTSDEAARARELGALLDRVAEPLRAAPVPPLADRVMASLPAQGPARGRFGGFAAWLWRPRSIRLRPVYAMGAAAAIAAAAVLARDPRPAPRAAVSAAAVVYVQFRMEASARQVALAGTFTGWQPSVRLHETEPGVWVALVPLLPGVYDYAFVVDGRHWVPDPSAPQQVKDSFGGTNSRISLPPLPSRA